MLRERELLRVRVRERERLRLDRDGTLPPARRASDNPIAIACFRLVTRLPELPLRSVPRLRSCMARFTLASAFFPYLLGMAAPWGASGM